ncbi:MAG: hypothetical protein QW589_07325 [Candidatus Bathyarchaeia archaeon]
MSLKKKNYFFKAFCLIVALFLKLFLSAYSVWSYEFISIVNASTIEFSYKKAFHSLWIYLFNTIYNFWLLLPINHPDLKPWLINFEEFPNFFESYLLILLFKAPIIFFDFLCGLLIYSLTKKLSNERKAILAMSFWIFNPYLTLTIEMSGTLEVIPLAFMLFSFLMLMNKKIVKSFLALASGIALKLLPVLAFPVYAILIAKLKLESIKKRILSLILAIVTGIILYAIPFYFSKKDFLSSLLEYTPQTFYISEVLIRPPVFTIGLSSFFSCFFLLVLLEYWDWKNGFSINQALEAIIGYFIIFLAFFNWYPSYLLLAIPFLAIDFALNKPRRIYVILWFLFAFLFSLIAFDYTPSNSLFFISSHGEFASLLLILLKWIKEDKLMNLIGMPFFRSAFTGVSIFYALIIILENSSRIKKTILKMN